MRCTHSIQAYAAGRPIWEHLLLSTRKTEIKVTRSFCRSLASRHFHILFRPVSSEFTLPSFRVSPTMVPPPNSRDMSSCRRRHLVAVLMLFSSSSTTRTASASSLTQHRVYRPERPVTYEHVTKNRPRNYEKFRIPSKKTAQRRLQPACESRDPRIGAAP